MSEKIEDEKYLFRTIAGTGRISNVNDSSKSVEGTFEIKTFIGKSNYGYFTPNVIEEGIIVYKDMYKLEGYTGEDNLTAEVIIGGTSTSVKSIEVHKKKIEIKFYIFVFSQIKIEYSKGAEKKLSYGLVDFVYRNIGQKSRNNDMNRIGDFVLNVREREVKFFLSDEGFSKISKSYGEDSRFELTAWMEIPLRRGESLGYVESLAEAIRLGISLAKGQPAGWVIKKALGKGGVLLYEEICLTTYLFPYANYPLIESQFGIDDFVQFLTAFVEKTNCHSILRDSEDTEWLNRAINYYLLAKNSNFLEVRMAFFCLSIEAIGTRIEVEKKNVAILIAKFPIVFGFQTDFLGILSIEEFAKLIGKTRNLLMHGGRPMKELQKYNNVDISNNIIAYLDRVLLSIIGYDRNFFDYLDDYEEKSMESVKSD